MNAEDVCADGAFITDRVCACKPDEYFGGSSCSDPSEDSYELLIDVKYTLYGQSFVQHQGATMIEWCADDEFDNGGFVSLDQKHCVYECSGEYQPAPDNKTCECADGYVRSLRGDDCVPDCGSDHVAIVNGQCTCTDGFQLDQT